MNITDVPDLPPGTADLLERNGMAELYPPQADAVEAGVTEGANIVASVPTASGKTLIAELAMLAAIHRGGTALYIVPLRALAAEKRAEFERFEPLGIDVGVSTGDYDSTDEWLAAKDIIVATSEKVDSLIRNGASWIDDLTCVVADEIHLVDSPDRGPTLEVTLAKLRRRTDLQLVALSATIGNATVIADWLDATLIDSTWRPVELRRGVHYGNAITFDDGSQYELDTGHDNPTAAIVADTAADDGSTLVFVNSRRNAEAAARRLATATDPVLTETERDQLEALAADIEAVSDTDTSRDLAATVRKGAAFHHAGLHADHRSLIETAFRDRDLKVITATPTLAAGVNTPSRRVIVRDWRRYNPAQGGMTPLSVLEVHQMFGRAGRPGLDPYGEAVLLATDHDEYEDLTDRYITAEPEPVRSKLATEPALRTHVLATIATGYASTRTQLLEFLEDTLYATQTTDPHRLAQVVDAILDYLAANDFLTRAEHLEPTRIGRVVSWLYLDPMSAAEIIDGLRDNPDPTPLGLYHLISRTPDMYDLYLRSGEDETYTEIAYERTDEFLGRAPSEFETQWEDWLSALKTARLIEDWTDEVTEDRITTRYHVGPGDIRAKVDTAAWLLNATERLAEELDTPALTTVRSARQRVEHGVKAELLDLVAVRGIGRVRARKLYDAGIDSRAALRDADKRVVLRALDGQRKTTENILRNAGRPDPTIDETRVTVDAHATDDPEPSDDEQAGLSDFK